MHLKVLNNLKLKSMKTSIGKRISDMLISKNRDEQWLADAIGKHRTTVSRIINGETQPNKSTIHLLANALESNYSYIAFGIGEVKKTTEDPVKEIAFDPARDTLYLELKGEILFYRDLIKQMAGGKPVNFLQALNLTGPLKKGSLGAAA